MSVAQLLAWLHGASVVAALLTVPSVLLERRGRATAALSWLLFLGLWPLGGVLAWWLIGRTHLERKRRRRRAARRRFDDRLERLCVEADSGDTQPGCPPEGAGDAGAEVLPWRRLPVEIGGVFPPSHDNHVELLIDGQEAFARFEEQIENARHHVHLLFYIWHTDTTGLRLLERLEACARRGVEVRLLYDPVGSSELRAHAQRLEAAGLRLAEFLPPHGVVWKRAVNFRNHRKIIVVDGRWGYTGGFNVGDEYRSAWHDMGLGIEGAAVLQLQEVFAQDWYFTTGEDLAEARYFEPYERPAPRPERAAASCAVVSSGPDLPWHTIHDALLALLERASTRAWLCTPYLVPTAAVRTAMRLAVLRGVDVRLLVPARNDVWLVALASRSYYPELLASGVRIFEYEPRVLHAKSALFDDERLYVGSANMDTRSFRLNFEVGCFVRSRELAARLQRQFEHDWGVSREVRAEALERTPRWRQLCEAAAHLLSPLL